MPSKILIAPKLSGVVLDIARSLAPPEFELVNADVGSEAFLRVAPEIEFYLGRARKIDTELFRAAPRLKLVQLLSAGHDRVDVEAARRASVPVRKSSTRSCERSSP